MTRPMTARSPLCAPSCAIPPWHPSRSARRPCAPSTPPCSALRAGRRAYGIYGRGVVLVDLRPEAEAAVSYISGTLLAASGTLLAASGTLLAASDSLLPPYIVVQVMVEGYDLDRAVLVVVHTTPLFMVYRLDRTPGAPPPDAPLIDFDQ